MKTHDSNEHAQSEPISGEIYHVTPTRHLESIFRDGLRPQIGPRSALLGEAKEMVYFFGSMLAVEDALSNWLGEALDDEPGAISVLAVDRSGLHLVSDGRYELACPHLIRPENISLAFQDDVPADERNGPVTGGHLMSKLTPKFVKDVDQPGSYQDGRGLILRVSATLRKSWVFRYMLAKQRHDLALGTFPALSLRDARLEADKYRLDIARGVDPAAERAKAKAAKASRATTSHTFRASAERYIRTHSSSWSKKHHQQWQNSLTKHVYPVIGGFRIAEVDTDDILDVLTPIWSKIPVTANRIRNRIELVLDAAKALKLRQGENPARWRGHLDKLLPKQSHTVVPFPSPTPSRTAELLARLDSLDGAAARAVEFAILTATRNQEVSGAQWAEIDWEEKIWLIPAGRMKAGKAHRVPLTDQMIEVLRQQVGKHAKWIFLNSWRTGPIPGNAMARVLDQLKVDGVVPHGFRSTFRTWAAEETDHQREVCEMALAHTLNSKVEAAYNRGDLLDKRRALMEDWGRFLAANAPQVRGKVSEVSEMPPNPGSDPAKVQPAA